MRRLVRLLARMYPTEWRARYGDEFDALLEDKTPRLRDVFDVGLGALKMQILSRSFVRVVLPCAFGGALIAVAFSFARTPVYFSEAPIEVTGISESGVCGDQHNLPAQFRGPGPAACVASYFNPTSLNREFLAKTIESHHLYSSGRSGMTLEDAIATMRKNIYIRIRPPAGRRDRFNLVVEFDYPDARLAQQVNGELMEQFIRMTLADAGYGNSNASQMRSRVTFRLLKGPSLPKRRTGLNWAEMGVIGLVGGFLGGVMVAVVLQYRKVAAVG